MENEYLIETVSEYRLNDYVNKNSKKYDLVSIQPVYEGKSQEDLSPSKYHNYRWELHCKNYLVIMKIKEELK